MLLGSPPDMVHELGLRKTGASTPLWRGSNTTRVRVAEFTPAVADCGLQGTAGSPASAALLL